MRTIDQRGTAVLCGIGAFVTGYYALAALNGSSEAARGLVLIGAAIAGILLAGWIERGE